MWRGFDDIAGGEEGEDGGLPEGEEDYKFNGKEFEERLVFDDVGPKLDVKLDQEEHCERYSHCDYDLNLWVSLSVFFSGKAEKDVLGSVPKCERMQDFQILDSIGRRIERRRIRLCRRRGQSSIGRLQTR